jgi:hypothetical protein
VIGQKPAQKPPLSARSRDMATNSSAVDHMLSVVGETQIDQRLQQCVPDALFGPAPESDIHRVPLAVALMHVAPGATDPQHVKHAIENTPVIARWPRPSSPFRRKKRPDQFPFRVWQIPTVDAYSPKCSLESELGAIGNPFCRHSLVLIRLW